MLKQCGQLVFVSCATSSTGSTTSTRADRSGRKGFLDIVPNNTLARLIQSSRSTGITISIKHYSISSQGPSTMGLSMGQETGPSYSKPHGSLKWYLESSVAHVRKDLLDCLYKGSGKEDDESVYRFLRWRAPKSKLGREYDPWIVPPTHLKRFRHPMLRILWERSVQALSTAKRVYFVGYSQPEAGLAFAIYPQVRFLQSSPWCATAGHKTTSNESGQSNCRQS